MAIKSNADKLNRAIVRKVESVLNNTDRIDALRIVIEGSRTECTTIQYNIREIVDFSDMPTDIECKPEEGEA